jgi:hypothetical protein
MLSCPTIHTKLCCQAKSINYPKNVNKQPWFSHDCVNPHNCQNNASLNAETAHTCTADSSLDCKGLACCPCTSVPDGQSVLWPSYLV